MQLPCQELNQRFDSKSTHCLLIADKMNQGITAKSQLQTQHYLAKHQKTVHSVFHRKLRLLMVSPE